MILSHILLIVFGLLFNLARKNIRNYTNLKLFVKIQITARISIYSSVLKLKTFVILICEPNRKKIMM